MDTFSRGTGLISTTPCHSITEQSQKASVLDTGASHVVRHQGPEHLVLGLKEQSARDQSFKHGTAPFRRLGRGNRRLLSSPDSELQVSAGQVNALG